MFIQSMPYIFLVPPPSSCTECSPVKCKTVVEMGPPPALPLQKPIASAALTAAHIRPLPIQVTGSNCSSLWTKLFGVFRWCKELLHARLKHICLVSKFTHKIAFDV